MKASSDSAIHEVAPMPKSCSRIAGGVLVIATAGSAAAQISTLNELEAALLDCWEPPPIEQSRPGTQSPC